MGDQQPNIDQILFEQIAEGDEQAFRQLYDRYDAQLFSFLTKLTRDRSIAEEIMQETFLRVWLYRDALAQVTHPKAYIHRIAANVAHQWMKRILQTTPLPADHEPDIPGQQADVHDQLEGKHMAALIARIINEMPEQRRRIYRLHRDQGLTSGEIARQLGISSSTVRNTLAAAIKFIRERLEETGYTLIVLFIFH